MAHRAAANLFPENTIRSIREAAALGCRFVDGGDWWTGADGSLIGVHDSTLDRTINATGNTTDLTALSRAALKVDASAWFTPGQPTWPDEPIPTWTDVLVAARQLGLVVSPEAKDATAMTKLIAETQRQKMEKAVIIASAVSIAALAPAHAAGIKTMYIAGGPTPTAATLTAGGIDFVAYDASNAAYNAAYLGPLQAAGIKLHAWTIDRRKDWATEIAKGVPLAGVHSNDPLYVLGQNTVLTKDLFAAQTWMNGMIPSAAIRGQWRGAGKFGINGQMGVLQGWGSKDAPWSSIQATFTYETTPDTNRFAYIGVADSDAAFSDGGGYGRGYVFTVRPNGNLQIYKRIPASDGGGGSQLGSTVTTPAIAAGGTCQIKAELLAANALRLTRLDGVAAPYVLDVTDSGTMPTRSGYWHFGVNDTSLSGIQASLSGVTLA